MDIYCKLYKLGQCEVSVEFAEIFAMGSKLNGSSVCDAYTVNVAGIDTIWLPFWALINIEYFLDRKYLQEPFESVKNWKTIIIIII